MNNRSESWKKQNKSFHFHSVWQHFYSSWSSFFLSLSLSLLGHWRAKGGRCQSDHPVGEGSIRQRQTVSGGQTCSESRWFWTGGATRSHWNPVWNWFEPDLSGQKKITYLPFFSPFQTLPIAQFRFNFIFQCPSSARQGYNITKFFIFWWCLSRKCKKNK